MGMDKIKSEVLRCVDALYDARGSDAAEDFMVTQLAYAVSLLPKTKQQLFLAGMRRYVGDHVNVTVTNCLTGRDVTIRWDQRGTCPDPSTETYHSM